MTKIINIDDLTRAAKHYDPVLKTLPFTVMEPVLTELGINLLEVRDGENIEITFERKGGLLKPYTVTNSDKDADEKEVGRFIEMPLVPKKAYAALKDHIDNYEDKKVLNNVGEQVDQEKKNHPLEKLIVESKVTTVAEDMVDAMFHSEYDAEDESPMGISDGFFTIQTKFVASGDIAESKGNLKTVGSLAAPDAEDETDATAFLNILAWLRKAHPHLKRQNANLYITTNALLNVMDAAANKFRRIDRVNPSILQEILREQSQIKNLNIKSHPCMGTGTRIFLGVNGLLDYGMTKLANKQFVSIRSPYPDPNWIQFWLQLKLGQRQRFLHEKMFMMSEGTVESLSLSGDYTS